MDFASDASWRWTTAKKDGWERPNFDDAAWQGAVALDESKLATSDGRHMAARFSRILSGPTQYGKIRAALVKADPMTVALGRPNREQVITTRASAATTLQALELTNGSTLDSLLKRGAEKLSANKILNAQRLIDELCQRAFGRGPTSDELAAAREIVGEPANKTGVEDLLWAVAMLPEFQLIY